MRQHRGLAAAAASGPGASLARSMMAQQDQADQLYQHMRRGPLGEQFFQAGCQGLSVWRWGGESAKGLCPRHPLIRMEGDLFRATKCLHLGPNWAEVVPPECCRGVHSIPHKTPCALAVRPKDPLPCTALHAGINVPF